MSSLLSYFGNVSVLFFLVAFLGGPVRLPGQTKSSQEQLGAVIVLKSKQIKPQSGASVNRYGLTREDFHQISRFVGNSGTIIPIRKIEQPVIFQTKRTRCQIVGTIPEITILGLAKVTRGRFLTSKDLKQNDNVCVLNEEASQEIFGTDNPIGKSIRVRKNVFTVVGTVSTQKNSTENKQVVFVPLSTMRLRFGDHYFTTKKGNFEAYEVQLHEILICLNRSVESGKVVASISNLIRKIHPTEDYSIEKKLFPR